MTQLDREQNQNLPLGDDSLLTEQQAAKLFPYSPKTLANLRFKGRGPTYHKVGRNVYYRFGDLREFFNQGRVEPGSLK